MRKIFLCLGLMSALPLAAQVAISASDVTDSFEHAVPLARLCFTPVNANAAVSGFRVGSNQVIPNEVCGTITTGVLQSGLTLAPTPTGIGYHVYVKASNSNNVLRDYCTVPITGSTWTLDTLDCPSVGPLPTSTVVTSVNGNSGAFDLVGSGVSCATVSGVYTCTVSGGGGVSAPSTTNLFKGNGSGGILAAAPGTDYVIPSGNVATATALAANGTNCGTGQAAQGVDASGNAEGCFTPSLSGSRAWSCQPGFGDGLNATASGTYLSSTCKNTTGATITITGVQCFTDNNGASTVNVTNGAGTSLLTGAVTCTSSFASGTQSSTTTIANGDYLKFTWVLDGTTKQLTGVVSGTY